MKLSQDVAQAALLTAYICGALMLCCLLASFWGVPHLAVTVNGTRIVLGHKPPGHHCFLCGMTRSFCAASQGKWGQALRDNRFGPAFYGVFWAGSAWFVLSALGSSRRLYLSHRTWKRRECHVLPKL